MGFMSVLVTLTDAKTRLGELVELAARGEEIVISRRGKPVALVSKTAHRDAPTQPGALLGAQLGNHYRLTPEQQTRLEGLAAKNQKGVLSPEEHNEMMALLDEFGRLTVSRAQALSEMP
jgi:prevent-host-death family protein